MTKPEELRKHIPVDQNIEIVKGIRIVHEFDAYGNHRIVSGYRTSDWVSYRSIAKLEMLEKSYIAATTEYYKGELPSVFLLSWGE